jgi:glycolate oxidase FAD binding subunit
MTSTAEIPQDELPAGARLIEPGDAAELARQLAAATKEGLAVIPRGGGTKSDWGNPPERADVILSTRRLDRVIEHAAGDMTATVEAGCTIEKLQSTLALRGQRLAIDPLWPDRATIGGVLATNDNGSLRGAFGSLRDLIIGATVSLADGTLARSGGKVVKNVAGYDLPKLMVGAFGTLGVITQATFRLYPLPPATRPLSWSASDFAAVQRFVLAVLDATGPLSRLEWTAGRDIAVAVNADIEGSSQALDATACRLEQLARSCGLSPVTGRRAPEAHRKSLWEGPGPAAICRFSFLPSNSSQLCQLLNECVPGGRSWGVLMQAAGAGWLRLTASHAADLASALRAVRRKVEMDDGSLVVLRCPPEVGRGVDAWGYAGDALPLMKRVKRQFDPSNTLNPGRFVGGI